MSHDPLYELDAQVRAAVATVRGDAGEPSAQLRLERSRREDQGDYSTNAAMLLAPVVGRPPREIAEQIGAELSASIQEECFWHLQAPIVRATGWDTPYPLAFEWQYFPGPARLMHALKTVMEAS